MKEFYSHLAAPISGWKGHNHWDRSIDIERMFGCFTFAKLL